MSGVGTCANCDQSGYVMPLHGEKGGPLMCPFCCGEWHGEYGKRRKYGRIVIKAMKAYLEFGSGNDRDLGKLKDSAIFGGSFDGMARFTDPLGYGADSIGAEVGDITAELLADTLQLTHPDRHPPERKELAKRVTAELLALKPFVFPAPKPEPPPAFDGCANPSRVEIGKPSKPPYPCDLCADTTPSHYCDACKAENEKDQQEKRNQKEERRQQRNARQRQRYATKKYWRDNLHRYGDPKPTCQTCGAMLRGKRRDAKYCSALCKQKAYLKRDGLGSNTKPLSAREVERAIRDAVVADNAFTVDDLCGRVYPEPSEKKHRVAVIAAAKKIEGLECWQGDTPGRRLVFFYPTSAMAWGMARLKSDWLYVGDSEEQLRARAGS